MGIEEKKNYNVCLKDFRHTNLEMDKNRAMIAEGLIKFCGLQKVWDSPNGKRVFTVEKMPDNVPIAEIYWEEFEYTNAPDWAVNPKRDTVKAKYIK